MNDSLNHDEFRGRWARVGCAMTGVLFVAAGVNHFVHPAFYERIIPPGFASPSVLVALSGIFEVLGGVGLMVPVLRRAAAWGLIALLVCVFPANIYMALAPEKFADLGAPAWGLWARLPLQLGFIGWVWAVGLRRDRANTAALTPPGP